MTIKDRFLGEGRRGRGCRCHGKTVSCFNVSPTRAKKFSADGEEGLTAAMQRCGAVMKKQPPPLGIKRKIMNTKCTIRHRKEVATHRISPLLFTEYILRRLLFWRHFFEVGIIFLLSHV